MMRSFSLAAVVGLCCALPALGEPARFKFEKGQVLTYNVVQATKVNETIIDEKTNKPVEQEHITKHTVIRKWKVVDVDAKGVATLEMTIAAMKWQNKGPDGALEFDSEKPEQGDDPKKVSDDNKKEMSRWIGPVLAVIRIDSRGKLVEVKESKFGSPSRFATELPFKIVLPEAGPKEGQTWDRSFTIQLDPPQGTGEKYEAMQKYTAKAPVNGYLTIGISTALKAMPTQPSDQIPLLPMLMEGEVYFHEGNGRYYAARMKIKKELMNHQGDGSKYIFESTYAEDLKTDK